MIYGRTDAELLNLNEDSVWYGGPQNRLPKDAFRHLQELRDLIREGRQREAEQLVRLAFFAYPSSQRHYEPLGNLYLEFGHHDESKIRSYRRELDLDKAVTTVQYAYEGVQHRREVFTSYPDQVLVVKVESSELQTFVVRLNRVSEREYETNEFLDSLSIRDGTLLMHATPGGKGSNRLCCATTVECHDAEGSVSTVGNSLVVRSRKATVYVAAQTTFRMADIDGTVLSNLASAIQRTDLWERHLNDYQRLYTRLSLSLYPSTDLVPTDERLQGETDPGLVALYHNYGRYLLIACSRPGFKALPATLQGIWNPSFQPAWGSK